MSYPLRSLFCQPLNNPYLPLMYVVILVYYLFIASYYRQLSEDYMIILWAPRYRRRHGPPKQVLSLWFLFSYSWNIVFNTIQYMIFHYGLLPILIQRILISFEVILEKNLPILSCLKIPIGLLIFISIGCRGFIKRRRGIV